MIPLQRLLLLILLLLPAGLLAAVPTLPRPAELEPAVEFWTRIYTEFSVAEGVIHDSNDSMRILGVVAVAEPPHWQQRRSQVRDALKRYREALEALAEQSLVPRNALEQDIAARLPTDMRPEDLPELAQRLRFQGGLRERFQAGLTRSGRWRDYIEQVLESHGVPAELVALPHVESSFNPIARSHAGAAGLWQFTAGTGRRFMRIDPVLDERLDPWASTRAAAQLLSYNYAEIESWPLAITAYNHGLNGMRRAVREVGSRDYGEIRRHYDGPRFGFASRNFYPALLAAADVDARASEFFGNLDMEPPLEPARIALPHYTPLATLLDGVDINEDVLQALNPGLGPAIWDGRKFIPRGYALALPAGSDWGAAIAGLPGSRLYRGQRPDVEHRVAAGDTLSTIAARYSVSVSALKSHNGIANADFIRIGQQLSLPLAGAMPAAVGGRHYEVRPGDTLGAIAQRHGIGLQRLARLNGLENPDRLRIGQRLLIDTTAVAAVDSDVEP